MEHGDCDNAEKQYLLALRNAQMLDKKLTEEKSRLREIDILKERNETKAEGLKKTPEEKAGHRDEKKNPPEKPKKSRERALAVTHTVKRGETLPYIASLPEVYNDPEQWPLLYRANRDQIRDPDQIWPGQILRIPRNSGRQETTDGGRSPHE